MNKTCKVHGVLTPENIQVLKWKNKTFIKCRHCERERSRRYMAKKELTDPDFLKRKNQRRKAEWVRDKERLTEERKKPENIERRKQWYKNNIEKVRTFARNKQREYRKNLADPYVKHIIHNDDKNLPIKIIPQDLVELKRNIMKLRRKIDEKSNFNLKEALKDVDQHDRRFTKHSSKKHRTVR